MGQLHLGSSYACIAELGVGQLQCGTQCLRFTRTGKLHSGPLGTRMGIN